MADLDFRQVKRFAWMQLKGRWLLPLVVQVITGVVSAMYYFPSFVRMARFIEEGDLESAMQTAREPSLFISMVLLTLVVRVFFVAELEVYAAMTRGPGKVSFAVFIEGFADWGRAAAVTLWKGLFLYLWSLLFFIPAVIKFYSYYFAEYITAEFPSVRAHKAAGISCRVTSGAKRHLFLLDVTLLPWAIAGIATSGIAFIWAMPYIRMTHINAFHALLKGAIKEGRISLEELGVSPEGIGGEQ